MENNMVHYATTGSVSKGDAESCRVKNPKPDINSNINPFTHMYLCSFTQVKTKIKPLTKFESICRNRQVNKNFFSK